MAETELSPKITMIPHGTFLESHPDYCKVWPPMPPQTFRELTDTITVAALRRHPVIIYEGMILDGQHRFQAAQIRGMDCPSREYIGDDPGGYVIQENATRRHSPLNMIAQVVVGIRDLQPRGRPQTDQETRQYSSEELASEIGASPSTVERARQIEREGLGDQVRSGDLTANEAINQIRSNRQPSITRTPIQDDRSPDEFDDQESDVDADADPAGDDGQDFPDFGSTPAQTSAPVQEIETKESPDPRPAQTSEEKGPTRLQREQIRADAAVAELADARTRIEDLESRVVFDGDTEALIAAKDTEIRTLKSQVNEWMSKCQDAERTIAALRKQLEGTPVNA